MVTILRMGLVNVSVPVGFVTQKIGSFDTEITYIDFPLHLTEMDMIL